MYCLPHGFFRMVLAYFHRAAGAAAGRAETARVGIRVLRPGFWCLACVAMGTAAWAQFKEVGPPPFSPAVARQKVRNLLDHADPGNPKPAVDGLLGLVPWYRDIVDQELIAGWQRDGRANLTPVIEPLADEAVAKAIIAYSWRQAPEATFNLADAPLLGELMARYPDSATPFLADLLAPEVSGRTPLTSMEAQAVCRILLDMPDVGTWKKSASQILPRYRQIAVNLLNQDLHGDDREKAYRAQMWLRQLGAEQPATADQPGTGRRRLGPPPAPATGGTPGSSAGAAGAPPPTRTVDGRPTLARADSAAPPPDSPAPSGSSAVAATPAPPSLLSGATSGTLKCTGGPVPQNAEYVFRNLPAGNMRVELDTKVWDAHLAPDGQTQKLILRNKSSGPQKHCVVHWSVGP